MSTTTAAAQQQIDAAERRLLTAWLTCSAILTWAFDVAELAGLVR